MVQTCIVFFFFKQKTAYEMRISDWSSDVCSSDLFVNNLKSPITLIHDIAQGEWDRAQITYGRFLMSTTLGIGGLFDLAGDHYEIGRASGRERVCQYW